MVFVFLGLASIAGTVFSVAFVTWIVALIINKKDLIKRAWKFTWISFIVAVSIGVVAALGIYSSSNHSSDSDTEQVADADDKDDEDDDNEGVDSDYYDPDKDDENDDYHTLKDAGYYGKNAPKHDPLASKNYVKGVLSKYNKKNGYRINYYHDTESTTPDDMSAYYFYDTVGHLEYVNDAGDGCKSIADCEKYYAAHPDEY